MPEPHLPVSLLSDLDAFLVEHQRCGVLDGELAEPRPGKQRVWMLCLCGGHISRAMEPQE